MVGISKSKVGDSMNLPLGELAALGYCQPDGIFITTLADLRELLAGQALAGEAVVARGRLAGQRPRAPAHPTGRAGGTPDRVGVAGLLTTGSPT